MWSLVSETGFSEMDNEQSTLQFSHPLLDTSMSSDVENQDIVDDLQNGNKSPPVLSPVKSYADDFQNEDLNSPVLSPVKGDGTPPPSPEITEANINPPASPPSP